MRYAQLKDGEILEYVKSADILCEDPTQKGFKELVIRLGDGGTYETDTQIIVEINE